MCARSWVDDLLESLEGLGILRLPDVKQRFLAQRRCLIALGDGDEPVERGGVAALREMEDDFLPEWNAHPFVQRNQLVAAVSLALRQVEERVLSQLLGLSDVRDYRSEPAALLGAR